MCADADTDTANKIATCSDSKRIHTRNARSIHRCNVDTCVFSSSLACRALKSFQMLLDRRRRLVNELCIIQPLSIIMCPVSFLS